MNRGDMSRSNYDIKNSILHMNHALILPLYLKYRGGCNDQNR